MNEVLDIEILDKAMWNIYETYKSDDFIFSGYSNQQKIEMIEYILPYFEMIEQFEICKELKHQMELNK